MSAPTIETVVPSAPTEQSLYVQQLERAREKLQNLGYNILAVTKEEGSHGQSLALDLGMEIELYEDLPEVLRASSKREVGRMIASVLPLQILGAEKGIQYQEGDARTTLAAIYDSRSVPIARVDMPTAESQIAMAIVSSHNGQLT